MSKVDQLVLGRLTFFHSASNMLNINYVELKQIQNAVLAILSFNFGNGDSFWTVACNSGGKNFLRTSSVKPFSFIWWIIQSIFFFYLLNAFYFRLHFLQFDELFFIWWITQLMKYFFLIQSTRFFSYLLIMFCILCNSDVKEDAFLSKINLLTQIFNRFISMLLFDSPWKHVTTKVSWCSQVELGKSLTPFRKVSKSQRCFSYAFIRYWKNIALSECLVAT